MSARLTIGSPGSRPRAAARAVAISLLATALAVACGARTDLPVPRRESPVEAPDAGPDAPIDAVGDVIEEDALPPPVDAPPDIGERDVFDDDCTDPTITYIYVVTSQNELWSFRPASLSFDFIGALDCQAFGASPFSMGVDRQGTAYVVYTDGSLFRVSIADASCEAVDFPIGQSGFFTFGMGFATKELGPEEQLFVSDSNFEDMSSNGLGVIDTGSLVLTPIGPYLPEMPGLRAELTGTGAGRLFGLFLSDEPGAQLAEIDKETAQVLSTTFLPVGGPESAFAFAHWGNEFYLFTTSGGVDSTVTRYTPDTDELVAVASLGTTIVGAGVSTCAPQ